MNIFTKRDIGCYADGTFGTDHRRHILCDLLSNIGGLMKLASDMRLTANSLSEELIDDLPDDYSDEDDAIDFLNELTEDGSIWTMVDGDLLLIEKKELDT